MPHWFDIVGECSPWQPRGQDAGLDRLHDVMAFNATNGISDNHRVSVAAVDLNSLIHRDHRDAVVFCRHNERGMLDQLCEVRAWEIPELLPGFFEYLTRDAYQSLNGFKPARGNWHGKPSKFGIKGRRGVVLPAGNRTKNNLARLNAVWADLDCHPEMTPHMAIAKARELVARGQLPMWSIELYSGRGAWLIWLLGKEGTQTEAVTTRSGIVSAGKPIEAERDRLALWELCCHTVTNRLRALKADPKASEPTRVARVPGSVNTKSGEEVYFAVHRQVSTGLPACYSLIELSRLLCVELPRRRKRKPAADVSPERSERARRAQLIGNKKRWDKLNRLAELRGGVHEGRGGGNFMSIAAQLGRLVFDRDGNKHSRPELLAELRAFNAKYCKPTFDDAEVVSWHRHQCHRVRRSDNPITNVISDKTIAEWLKITPEEAALIGWRHAGQIDEPKPTTPRMRAEHRRALLLRWVTDSRGGEVPTAREAREYLLRTMQDAPTVSMLTQDLRLLFGGGREDAHQSGEDAR